MSDMFMLFVSIVAVESMVELWRKAAPLQGVRRWTIKVTPFLYSKEQDTHLLECGYCLSVWLGFLMMILYSLMDSTAYAWFAGSLTIHRLSNFLHQGTGYIRDKQIDLRINRRR